MPSYAGGKAKIGSEIAEAIIAIEHHYDTMIPDWRRTKYIIEPFAGYLNISIHFAKQGRKIISNDINNDIIQLWKYLQSGNVLPSRPISKKYYDSLKDGEGAAWERGFYSVACAYSGIPFAGYRIQSSTTGQNFFKNTRSQIMDMSPYLSQYKFRSGDYSKLDSIVSKGGYTIYCDPPYKDNMFRCDFFNDFDHDRFWDTIRMWSSNNIVIVSEYTAPKDFTCVWEKDVTSVFSSKTKKQSEKLFVYSDIFITQP